MAQALLWLLAMQSPSSLARALFALSLPWAAGCPTVTAVPDAGSSVADAGPSVADAGFATKTVADIPLSGERNLDLLFVIDNSASMAQEQASLATNFSRFVQVLEDQKDGLPNLHIGVVSTDLGAGPYSIEHCLEGGDRGVLQSAPRGTCEPPDGAFIRDVADGQGGRDKNYSGTLAETFSCIAQLGTDGCGFEQPLEAMRRALDGSNPENAGFLRDDAYLAVVFISDEDDCSTEDPRMFDPGESDPDSALGAFSSFRCFEFGVQCDPDQPRAPGEKSSCEPRADSPFMYGLDRYVDFLRSLKPAGRVIVAGVTATASPVVIGSDDTGAPQLEPACGSPAGEAAPAVRFRALLDAFSGRSAMETICNDDLSDSITGVADLVDRSVGSGCLVGPIRDTDAAAKGVQPSCEVVDIDGNGNETPIPECENLAVPGNSRELPCYLLYTDPACDTESGLSVHRYPVDETRSDGRLVVRCEVE